ncbi:MAG TPA: HAD family hydrolase [Thermoanaerobaculia bacterium]
MTAPTALLFDFGGTLDADGIPWKDRFFALFREEGLSTPAERFDGAFYAADDALVGTLPKELSLAETVERLSRDLTRALGGDGALAERVADRFFGDAFAKLSANAPLLERLSARFRLGIVANFYGNLEAVCSGAGIRRHFGVTVDSAAVGFTKPDPRIFQAALAALEASPDRAVFVGDSLPRDMAGARRLGMPHVWLKPGQRQGCCPDDAVIASLAQLPEVLP